MKIAKITSKGQITIPANIRKKLKTQFVSVELKGDTLILKPVKDAGGILSKYAIEKSYEKIKEREEKVIEEGFTERENT
ncbi:AbrB/MazE/SpoVT family DNA-binding domain-containing protein [Desulfurobacterium atlanticum]|uniref:Looped-hinge helix DNA binding domain-containing protein, AbrB family n=1 Tax=Desulfurobacterium atlanticum TaxID=240169 RepID=A0A239AFF0_9BACT|nr:AbrB/MazE/SpoVT family DNA-binding domain-containing protein [Desulfurobacterium atlanticum]SNR93774.1 looped-hinge helix DNA binding domain-containing protein, AbrB family [Desulfurobacterium atlanticum]